MSLSYKRTEQLYLAFHTWRGHLDRELDSLDADYLQSLRTDMQRVLAHIEHEPAVREAAVRRNVDEPGASQLPADRLRSIDVGYARD